MVCRSSLAGTQQPRTVECGRHDGTGPAGTRERPVYVACLTCRAWGGRPRPYRGSRAARTRGGPQARRSKGDSPVERTLRWGDGPASPAPAFRARSAPAARPVRARLHHPAAAPRSRHRRPTGDRPAAYPTRGVRLLRRRRRRRAVAPPGSGDVRASRVPPVGAARRVDRRHRPRHPRPPFGPPVRIRPHRLHPDDAHRGRARGGLRGAGDRAWCRPARTASCCPTTVVDSSTAHPCRSSWWSRPSRRWTVGPRCSWTRVSPMAAMSSRPSRWGPRPRSSGGLTCTA